MNVCVRVTECRLCDGPLELIMAFAPTPPGDDYRTAEQLREPQPSYPLDLMRCVACGAVQLADTVDPKLIYSQYQYTTSISRGLSEHFARYAQSVLFDLKPEKGSLVIDVGSNDGTLLKHFKHQGCRVIGIDPAGRIAEKATAEGVPTYEGYLTKALAEEVRFQQGPAQIVTANHIMANVADLHEFIEAVKILLAPDGTFVFETGYWPAIMRNRLIDTIEHEHIHYFAIRPLDKFFERHDLRLVHVEEQPTKGGSLRAYVKWSKTAMGISYSEKEISPLESWARELEALRTQMRVVIERKPKKEKWVGYGAAVGSTLLLHYFGLGDVLSELWDDNPGKIGRFSPGYHLPVVKPQRGAASKVVILAWRYADEIMRQHPGYQGQFLIPLPEVKVA